MADNGIRAAAYKNFSTEGVIVYKDGKRTVQGFSQNVQSDNSLEEVKTLILVSARGPQQIWPGVQRQLLGPSKVKLTFPGGLSHEAFDSSGYVRPWYMLSFLERSYQCTFYRQPNDDVGSFVDLDEVFADAYHFNFICQLKASKNMYDVSCLKCPLEATMSLGHVGKSSFTRNVDVRTPSLVDTLFSFKLLVVHADRNTRKASPLPEWWMKKYKPFAQGDPVIFKQANRPEDPRKIMSYPITVMAGDIDVYYHVNFTAYLKYCHEGRVGAMLSRGQKVTPRDLVMPIKSVSMAFLGEGQLGDTLAVDHWEGEDGTWHFDLMKDQRPLYQAAMQLYDLELSKA